MIDPCPIPSPAYGTEHEGSKLKVQHAPDLLEGPDVSEEGMMLFYACINVHAMPELETTAAQISSSRNDRPNNYNFSVQPNLVIKLFFLAMLLFYCSARYQFEWSRYFL